jgi:hypothetical protein
MKARSISLINFRGFEQPIEIDFEPDLTVLAGVNGSGKSSILDALAITASHFLPVFTETKEQPLAASPEDIHSTKPALAISCVWNTAGGPFHTQITRAHRPDEEKAESYEKRRNEVRFALRNAEIESKEYKDLNEELRFLNSLLAPDKDHFSYQAELGEVSVYLAMIRRGPGHPFVVLYTTKRQLGKLPPKLVGNPAFEPANAFIRALEGVDVSLTDFALWFKAASQGDLGDYKLGRELLPLLEKVVSALLDNFKGLKLDLEKRPSFTIEKNGKRLSLDQLSDGERGLIALAFDLTRRLALANPQSENPIEEGEAVVLIDEIELHLHPVWQRKVVGRLLGVFKKCQFIVTTHSPMVLGEVKASQVRFIEFDPFTGKTECFKPHEAYGLDANRILDELMGASERNEDIENKLRKIFDLIDREDFGAARKSIAAIVPQLGQNDPEITRANALIKFLEGRE